MDAIRFGVRLGVRDRTESDNDADVAITDLSRVAARLERSGVDALFVIPAHRRRSVHERGEMSVADPTDEIPIDPYVALGACAAVTDSLLLGTCPTPDDGRLPSLLAKAATGLDVVSNGRAVVIFDSPLDATDGASLERLGEQIEILRALSRVPAPSFNGLHYRLDHAWNEPHRSDGLSLGLIVAGLAAAYDGVGDRAFTAVDIAARFCDFLLVDAHGSGSKDEIDLELFGQQLRRAGRLRSSTQLLAMIDWRAESEGDDRGERIRRCEEVGFDGVVLDALGELVDDTYLAEIDRLVNALF